MVVSLSMPSVTVPSVHATAAVFPRPAIVVEEPDAVELGGVDEADEKSCLVTIAQSEEGLAFHSPRWMEPGAALAIDFWASDLSFAYSLQATVTAAAPAGDGWDIAIELTPPLSDAELSNLP